MSWIYIFTFPNGKKYVGQTNSFKERYYQHKTDSVTEDSLLYRAIRKYGWRNVRKEEMKCSEHYIDWLEIEWIKFLNCRKPNGYNIEAGGKHPKEKTRRLLSEKGKTHPGNMTGHKQSQEWSKNKSKEMIGNQFAKGTKHTDEWRKIQSEMRRGKPLSPEHNTASTKAKMKPILQFSKDGQFIKEWPSAKQASEQLGIARSILSLVVNGKSETAGNFKWTYK